MSAIIIPKPYNFITDRLAIGDVSSRAIEGWTAIVSILSTHPWDERYKAPSVPNGVEITCADVLSGIKELPPNAVPVLMLDIADGHYGFDKPTLSALTEFTAHFVKHGCVLWHCGAGLSRSVSAGASYFCRFFGMSLTEAFAFIEKRRPGICPWNGYKEEIKTWLKLDELATKGLRS